MKPQDILLASMLCCAAVTAQGDRHPELGAPFADNAILQRGMKVPIWGFSRPGTEVTVAFAGQKSTTTAGEDGKWMLTLDPLEASAAPRRMVIGESTGKSVTLNNILVGEVWLASGQSNMQWLAQKSSCSLLIKRLQARAKAQKSALPPIRECKVVDYFSCLHPIEHARGEWKDGDFGNYSAVAFAFALHLYEELQVPIGILNCSFSQTSIEAWTPRVGFAAGTDAHTQAVYRKILETDPATPEHEAAWNRFYQDLENTLRENAERIRNGKPAAAVSTVTPGNLRGNRDATWLFNARLNPMIPYAIRGGIWNQGYANTGGGLTYYDNLHSLVRGWRHCYQRPDLPVYFHQFYCPGPKGGWKDAHPSIGSTAEMRLGTWRARDIPNTGMASQIDIEGAIHYWNKAVPGQRLARHALKNQYGKDVVADGPMFKSYEVEGDKLIVAFDHAEGGLVVAETGTNANRRNRAGTGFADPKIIVDGDDRVTLFYLADAERVWHPAKMKIAGATVVLTAPNVKSPRGVSYGTSGVGFRPSLYNRGLLPATPFIYYDQRPVTRASWPDDPIRIAGFEPDPAAGGKRYEYRKMPILSARFRDDAVLQAGVPITFWGSAIHNWGYEADGEAVIRFRFAGIEKTIPVTAGMREWQVTIPAMPASAEPRTLQVTFSIDGKLVHERRCENLVFGDVWYVAAAGSQGVAKAADGMVRVMTRKAKRMMSPRPSRYSVAVSTTPKNRFASEWKNPRGGLAQALGMRIHERTGKPVGIVYMHGPGLELKHWIGFEHLGQAESLKPDYEDLAAIKPGNPFYDANVRRYVGEWKRYWNDYIPKMIAEKRVPDGAAWGSYPSLSGAVSTKATQAHNVMVFPFSACKFRGILFLCSESMFEKDQGTNFGPELSALANSWRETFGGGDLPFLYTIPTTSLAPKITRPKRIEGVSRAIEIDRWSKPGKRNTKTSAAVDEPLLKLVHRIVALAYEER